MRVDDVTVDMLHDTVEAMIVDKRSAIITYVNVNAMNLAHELPDFREFVNSANVVICDGVGVRLGIRILGHPFIQRIACADWIWQLAEFAEPRGYTFFFLGAGPNVAERAANALKDRFPGLRIVGVHHGYFDKTRGSPENEKVVQRINSAKPNILLVGFGMPLQERWLMENWDRLDVNVALTGGAVFDYVSGNLRRAPSWMTDHGMEWLGRLIIEPRRLWRRYLIGNPLFLWRVMQQRFGLLNP
jgi:N-acetylglucosaminyldiphosphoundecaprenol N-acetyl-beta-D-mannosaminyltransferase